MLLQQVKSQSITVSGTIVDGFRHNWDCCNDGVGCPFGIDVNGTGQPDPRYRVWVGWDGSNFSQSTNSPGLYSGCSGVYGADDVRCNVWDPGDITLPTLTGNMSTYNVEMESWEEDEGILCCVNDNCNKNLSGTGGLCFGICPNLDDTRCGRLRIGDISLCSYAPCTDHTFTGDFTSGSFLSMHNRCGDNNGAGYGLNQLRLNWSFNAAPTITLEPTDASLGGSPRNTCENIALSLEVRSDAKCGWTLARWVRWEESTDNVNWTAIAGTDNGSAFTTQTTFAFNPTLPNASPGSPLTRYYRAVLVSACTKPTTDAGWRSSALSTISAVMQVTVYDPSDAFCTAPQCNIMYVDPVNGNDANVGSPVLPKRTISNAAAPLVTYIRVAKCVSGCTDGSVVNIPNNCVIEGGYVRTGGSNEIWTKSSASVDETNITFSGQENAPGSNNSIRHIVAFKSDAKSGWSVKDLNITTDNTPASTFANDGRGMSNYGILIINNSYNYNVTRCKITVGSAGNGLAGTTPAGRGGAGGGGAGGGGGGGATGCGDPAGGATGTAGNGGAAGGAGSDIGNAGGCRVFPPRGNCSSGRPGKASPGSTGGNATTSYAIGNRPTAVVPTNNPYYIPATQSASGSNGFGGGGSRGGQCATCFDCGGNSGGTGATGGGGGLAGSGGFGGGGVFGIWIHNSNTGKNIQEINCTLGSSGLGGDGASGQLGALLVSIDNGNTGGGCVCGNPQGGSGGDGGAGGNGGRGRDGANGTTAQIVTDGATSTPGTSYTNASNANITLDNATKRNNIQGKMCRYSQIDMAAGTLGAGWVLPGGLSFLDTTSFGASYTNAQSTVSVTTDNANSFFNIGVNSGTLASYLYTVTDARTLPVINPTLPTDLRLCDGVSQSFTITSSYDVANIQERQWMLYQRSGVAGQTLTYVETANGISYSKTFTTSDKDSFVVRYRERHQCCGWSRPVFKYVYVYKLPTFTADFNLPICSFGAAPYAELSIVETTNLTGLTYNWTINSGSGTIAPASGSIAALATVNSEITGLISGGTTQVQATVTNIGCSNTSTPIDIVVNTRDDVVISTDTMNCYTCSIVDGKIYKYYDANGKLVAQLEDMTGSPYSSSSLGNTEICVRRPTPNIAPTPLVLTNGYLDGMPYLRRYWSINPGTDNLHARVTLFFNNAELDDLVSGATGSAYAFAKANYASALKVSKFPGGGALTFTGPDNIYTNNSTAGGESVVTGGFANSHPTWTGAVFGPSIYGGGNYQVSFIVDEFSTFYINPVRFPYEVLPVELISFTGWNQGAVNRLQWVTAAELNTSKFVIEKSVDQGVWSVIGEKTAAGNSSQRLTYDFTDNSPIVGNNYYRLKVVDLDNTFSYSNTINIPVGEAVVNNFTRVYPNPTSGLLNVEIQSTDIYDTKIVAYDAIGKKVLDQSSSLNKGLNTLQLDFSKLANGSYILQFSDITGKVHTTKFVKD